MFPEEPGSILQSCHVLQSLAQIDAMCCHLAFPKGGKYSSSIAVTVSIVASSVNDGSTWLGQWYFSGKERDVDHTRNELSPGGYCAMENHKTTETSHF